MKGKTAMPWYAWFGLGFVTALGLGFLTLLFLLGSAVESDPWDRQRLP